MIRWRTVWDEDLQGSDTFALEDATLTLAYGEFVRATGTPESEIRNGVRYGDSVAPAGVLISGDLSVPHLERPASLVALIRVVLLKAERLGAERAALAVLGLLRGLAA